MIDEMGDRLAGTPGILAVAIWDDAVQGVRVSDTSEIAHRALRLCKMWMNSTTHNGHWRLNADHLSYTVHGRGAYALCVVYESGHPVSKNVVKLMRRALLGMVKD